MAHELEIHIRSNATPQWFHAKHTHLIIKSYIINNPPHLFVIEFVHQGSKLACAT
jgi:hypothetical protein